MFEALVIFILLVVNGIFAMSEIALVSSRRSRLQQRADRGSTGAKIALGLLDDPEKFLSTVQIGITLVGIIAGAYGGEAFTKNLQPIYESISWLAPYAEEVAFLTIVIIITYFSLVLGELVPKSIAMNNPEGITVALAPFMRVLAIATYPLVAFLTISTKLLLKIMMIKEKDNATVTEEELRYMIAAGSKYGVIEKQEHEILLEVLRFGDRKVNSVMTPGVDVFWIDVADNMSINIEKIKNSKHNKIIIAQESLDHVLGYLLARDVLAIRDPGKENSLLRFVKEALFVPSNLPAVKLLDLFKQKRIHIAVVLDEYGGVCGIVTLHDILENIVGVLPELGDEDEGVMHQREDGSWLVDSSFRFEELCRSLDIDVVEKDASYTSVGGFFIHRAKRIPKPGDVLVYQEYRFEIMDMDKQRIDKLLVTKLN